MNKVAAVEVLIKERHRKWEAVCLMDKAIQLALDEIAQDELGFLAKAKLHVEVANHSHKLSPLSVTQVTGSIIASEVVATVRAVDKYHQETRFDVALGIPTEALYVAEPIPSPAGLADEGID